MQCCPVRLARPTHTKDHAVLRRADLILIVVAVMTRKAASALVVIQEKATPVLTQTPVAVQTQSQDFTTLLVYTTYVYVLK